MRGKAKFGFSFAVTFVSVIIFEIILRLSTYGTADEALVTKGLVTAILLDGVFAALIGLVASGIFKKFCKGFVTAVLITDCIAYCAQIVYYDIFGTFYTMYSMLNGGQVAEFQGIIRDAILDKIVPVGISILITIVLIVIIRKTPLKEGGVDRRTAVCALIIFAIGLGGSGALINTGDRGEGTPYDYLNKTNEIKGVMKSFGITSGTWLDAGRLVFGFTPRIGDVDKAMEEYFAGRTQTGTNAKTGIFEGKNLIFITAESFTDFAINEKYTPTLYKLQHEGFTFTNYYNPIWGVSTLDGEYVNMVGLIPESGVWSMTESSDNYLPYTLGNQFSSLGYVTKAYHNHDIKFYHRDVSHPNLGYDFDGQGGDFDFEHTWPESDLEMVDETTSDFLTPDSKGQIPPFHVYYLTVSGHLEYTFDGQAMSEKNRELVADLDLSDRCKAYMAANIELDKALELLVQRLDEAGVLEDTVIAIAGDHYPYGLDAAEISQFKGHQVDEDYEIYQSALIIWTPDMKAETVDKVSSNLDILPTISNLFGLDYDSGLLMGTDIFSDEEGIVVFEDRDWITEKGKKNQITDSEYKESINKKVSDMFMYSALILDKDYYRKVEGKNNKN